MGKYGLPSMGPEKDLLLVGIMVPKLGGRVGGAVGLFLMFWAGCHS